MTTRATIALTAPNHCPIKVMVEERIYDTLNARYSDEWAVVEEVQIEIGQCNDFYIHKTRRVTVAEVSNY